MIVLALLLGTYLTLSLVARQRLTQRARWRVALAAAMVIAGIAHLVAPAPFVQHLPTWVPARELIVLVSGLVEIGLGGALFVPQPFRRQAGLALAIFLVLVFPANVYVAVAGVAVDGQPGGLYPWLRLPWQALFVWLALWSTESTDHGARPAARSVTRAPAGS